MYKIISNNLYIYIYIFKVKIHKYQKIIFNELYIYELEHSFIYLSNMFNSKKKNIVEVFIEKIFFFFIIFNLDQSPSIFFFWQQKIKVKLTKIAM